MKKISIDELKQYVFDFGFEKTCEIMDLTVTKSQKILSGGKISAKQEFQYKEPVETIKVDTKNLNIIELYRVFGANYKTFHKKYCGNLNSEIINKFSQSNEDLFHDGFIKMVELSADFIYMNDTQTVSYINAHLFNFKKGETKKLLRDKKILVEFNPEKNGFYNFTQEIA